MKNKHKATKKQFKIALRNFDICIYTNKIRRLKKILNLESKNKIFNEDNILEELSKLKKYEQKLQNLLNKHEIWK